MKEEVLSIISKCINGQGNQIDISGKLSSILNSILELAFTPYNSCRKVEPFLYELQYNNIDYEKGKTYMERYAPVAQCSVVRKGDFVGRNLDELYDNSVSAIVRVSASDNRFASMGVVSAVPQLTKALMESNENADILSVLPFFVTDAMNEHGLFAEVNLLNREESKGKTIGTIPLVEEKDRICMTMLVRYIVDHYRNVAEAIDGLRDYVSIFAPDNELLSYEYHFLLADASQTVIIEFVNNELVVIEDAQVSTNFYLHGVTSNQDGTITRNTSTEPDAENVNGVTRYGSGIERYNIAVSNIADIDSIEKMKTLMRKLFFTKAYTLTEEQWFSEFVGGALTVTSPAGYFADIIQRARNAYDQRDRSRPLTWQTIHSVVYDLRAKTISVCVQEGDEYFDFDFYGISNGVIGDLADLETDHKSTIVEAINELFDVIETNEMVISMAQTASQRKKIYDECIQRPQLAKNIVFYNGEDEMYYRVNGYKISNGILYLNTLMYDNNILRPIIVQVGSNGAISII